MLEAFRRADGAEVDVLVTADGVPVLRHDERLADGAPVRSLRLAELRALAPGDPDGLPEVAAVLDALRGVGAATARLNLELKVPGAARALRPLAARPERFERVVFTSFFATEVLDAIALFPGRRVGLLRSHAAPGFVPPGIDLLALGHWTLPAMRRAHPTTPIWAWTVNDEAAAARAREACVEAVISDDVTAARAWFPA